MGAAWSVCENAGTAWGGCLVWFTGGVVVGGGGLGWGASRAGDGAPRKQRAARRTRALPGAPAAENDPQASVPPYGSETHDARCADRGGGGWETAGVGGPSAEVGVLVLVHQHRKNLMECS